jgi:hypothetical protein
MNEPTTVQYDRIVQAEKALTDGGFVRDNRAAIWVNDAGQRAKVMRDEVTKKFYVLQK